MSHGFLLERAPILDGRRTLEPAREDSPVPLGASVSLAIEAW
jgi:hypothetical protein